MFVRTKKKTTTTTTSQKSITTSQSQVVPVPLPRQSSSNSKSTTTSTVHLPELAPGVCSNITTIVFREEDDAPQLSAAAARYPSAIDSAADFVRLESLARQREETPPAKRSKTTTTTVHHRTITQLNLSQDYQHSDSPTTPCAVQPRRRTPPTTLQMHSSDTDSLLEESSSVPGDSATFQNIHKFQRTHESTPLSSPMSSSGGGGGGYDRFTSGDSLYQQHGPRSLVNYSLQHSCTASPVGSPLSGSHHALATDEWKFSKTHQFQTKTGFYRSISQYDSHIKEIRGEKDCINLGFSRLP